MLIPQLHTHLLPPAAPERVLHQCQEPTCGGVRRTRLVDPVCHGTAARLHGPVVMEPCDDFGQGDTAGLLCNDEAGVPC